MIVCERRHSTTQTESTGENNQVLKLTSATMIRQNRPSTPKDASRDPWANYKTPEHCRDVTYWKVRGLEPPKDKSGSPAKKRKNRA